VRKRAAPGIIRHIACLVAAAFALTLGGCARAGGPLNFASWFNLGKPNLSSFMGVRFGESVDRVRRELPDGSLETSPYGAEAYRVENLQIGQVRFDLVLFEFTAGSGMQLVIAHFSAGSAGVVLGQLKSALGDAPHSRSGPGVGPESLLAQWDLPSNEQVTFDGPESRVVLLGPGGSPLRRDIALRSARQQGTE
jgi:hypothetical protein